MLSNCTSLFPAPIATPVGKKLEEGAANERIDTMAARSVWPDCCAGRRQPATPASRFEPRQLERPEVPGEHLPVIFERGLVRVGGVAAELNVWCIRQLPGCTASRGQLQAAAVSHHRRCKSLQLVVTCSVPGSLGHRQQPWEEHFFPLAVGSDCFGPARVKPLLQSAAASTTVVSAAAADCCRCFNRKGGRGPSDGADWQRWGNGCPRTTAALTAR